MKNQKANYFSRYGLEIFEGTLTSHVYPWHYHDCYVIILLLKGSMKYIFRKEEFVLKQKQILVINPFASHYNLPITECEYRAIFLSINFVSNTLDNFSIIQFQNKIISNKRLFNLLLNLFEQIKTLSSKNACEKIENEIAELLLKNIQSQTKKIAVDKRIIPAIEFIKSNLGKKLTATEIAKTCHLSHFHFQRLFKESTGLTVNEYIHQLRTEFAKNLLRQGNRISDTSFETGYFDPSHFNKAFKKMWVTKPSQF
jgi:AraC-like DNA-binding protein